MRCISLAAAAAFAVTAIMAPATVSAAVCTEAEIKKSNTYDFPPMDAACPTIFPKGEPKIPDPRDPKTITKASLAEMSSCKTSLCISELTKHAVYLPDCNRDGVNFKRMFFATVDICKAFSAGDVTIAMATEIFKEVAKNASIFEQNLDVDSDNGAGNAGTPVVSSSKAPARCKSKK